MNHSNTTAFIAMPSQPFLNSTSSSNTILCSSSSSSFTVNKMLPSGSPKKVIPSVHTPFSPSTTPKSPSRTDSTVGFQMLLDKKQATTPPTSDFSTTLTDERRSYLYKFIQSGPIYKRAELTMIPEDDPLCVTDSYQTCLDDWIEMGTILEDALGSQSNDIRVYQYYLPVYFWILRELDRHLERERSNPQMKHRPYILGFCCPQGGGKTTMTTFIETLLRSMGKNVQIASLDDFYVTNEEQNKIAERYPDNRLMQYRGMPGTHDVRLLIDTLDRLRSSKPVSIPKYDKSAFFGRGDRTPKDEWKHISESTDVVLLEGWCLGFEPVHIDNLIDEHLNEVNDGLAEFVKVYSRLDGLFLIEIADMDWVYEWRLQAERGARAAGKNGLTDDQVVDFVDRFMPAYKQYSPPLYRRKTPLIPRHELHIQIDQNRCPIHSEEELK